MKILLLCTAHNSLSQRLYLALSRTHDVTIEYALSDEVMISAVAIYDPDLIICPFLTTLVPKEIYNTYMTLIIHPGPPGDVGPSALDWVLLGDDGSVDDSNELLKILNAQVKAENGRTHWGITVLQAIEEFDAGPVWAFEQFEIDIDLPGLTKSELYRGPITQAAISATFAAITRLQSAAMPKLLVGPDTTSRLSPTLKADDRYGQLSIALNASFKGGRLHHRPLLKAAQREFDITRHTAQQISRRIRCGDSQPGSLSKVFGPSLYVYGGQIEDNAEGRVPTLAGRLPITILGIRNQAICIATVDGKGIWITHIRRPKTKSDVALWPKVPATTGLVDMWHITSTDVQALNWPGPPGWLRSVNRTFQEVFVDMQMDDNDNKTACLYFDFYNGAMSTDQCSQLIEAMDFVLAQSTQESPIQAVVLMGGAYFSNGIALNVIEAAADPAMESWLSINRIDDVVHYLLHKFPSRDIVTVAAVRGNAAAGGVALACACDIVVAGSSVVLNPAYRGVGLYGSEYHTLSYYGRCGEADAKKILRSMTPMSPLQAQSIGLVDYVFPGNGIVLEDYVKTHISYLLKPGILKRGLWKGSVDLSPAALARARANELGEMSRDFWSARAVRYHSRRFDFVRKVKPSQTPLRFAVHRRALDGVQHYDEEETEEFDSVRYFADCAQDQLLSHLRHKVAHEVRDAIHSSSQQPPGEVSRQGSETTLVTPITPVSTLDRKMESIFSCYYKSVDDVPTPPESPGGTNLLDTIRLIS
ncbi:Hydrogenase maturation factor [Lecanosticta acicola]|uniref:Hydrogenase maturation factor n=1 Tax=Lecanosticta acicola TaxID=111012 RepID=A0AAI8YV06_9PEZI|nr:Hydrogenase maturation factor [Lecanosticta acicola]